jgi:allantoate deiminase
MNPGQGSEIGDAAATVMRRGESLANISEEPGLIVRPYGSQAMNEANNIVAMFFVRCERGISHNPAESVDPDDVGAAIEVVRNLLSLVSRRVEPGGAQEGE